MRLVTGSGEGAVRDQAGDGEEDNRDEEACPPAIARRARGDDRDIPA
jgi:hypothetical protein